MNSLKEYISQLRYDFSKQTLEESEIDKNPFIQFEHWFKDAVSSNVLSPNAMVLATTTPEGKPSARVMLLRDFTEKGFVFYTNYNSHKGIQLACNPYAAITFFWAELERQVRIEGIIEKQSEAESDDYFSIRPDGSKLGAWSSQQSEPVTNRAILEKNFKDIQSRFKGQAIPRPSFWGGYYLMPTLFEFWQGRPNRMHDRIVYLLQENKNWHIERLSP